MCYILGYGLEDTATLEVYGTSNKNGHGHFGVFIADTDFGTHSKLFLRVILPYIS